LRQGITPARSRGFALRATTKGTSAMLPATENIAKFARELDCIYCIERAITFDPIPLAGIWNVPVMWNFSLRTSAGRASRHGIELHPGLLQATVEEYRNTFLHELAHICELRIYGTIGHSREWWEAMIRLGEKPWITRHHNIASCLQHGGLIPSVDELFKS
jgi:hypothetical protein